MKNNTARIALALAICLKSSILFCDDREAAEQLMQRQFQGKIVALKHFYDGSRLEFGADGNLENGGNICAWTLCAQI